MTDSERLSLIREIYHKAHNGLESFEGHTGYTLAYLFGTIASSDSIDMWPDVEDDVELLKTFESWFPAEHPIWRFIVVQ